jgi:hypothetical protein
VIGFFGPPRSFLDLGGPKKPKTPKTVFLKFKTRRWILKNFYISGVTNHAIEQALSKGAPIMRPKKLKKLKKRGKVRQVMAAGGRIGFVYQDRFVYITSSNLSTVITVLTKGEYKNIMYS